LHAENDNKLPSGFYCYIVECADGSFYTGWATDPWRREHDHNHTVKGARYTRTRRPVRLVYVEPQPDRSTAMRREIKLKRLSHAKKQALAQKREPIKNITIRKAKTEDLPDMQAIARRSIDQCYRPFLGDESVESYINSGESDKELAQNLENCDILLKGEDIAAFAIYFDDLIHLMMVDVEMHRSGLGTMLLAHAEKQLRASGSETLHLETFEGNQQAINFYLKNGWTIAKKEKDANFDFVRVCFEK
jgi:predicted GIY-YIG superfamily endonuclease/N-acetylglutamate synthase-like GNAT family acetyltransferase